MTQAQLTCQHLELEKLADTSRTSYPSYKEGYRYWKCKECGLDFKAIPEDLKRREDEPVQS